MRKRYVCQLCLGSGELTGFSCVGDDDGERSLGPCPSCAGRGWPPSVEASRDEPYIEADFRMITDDEPAPAVRNSGQKDNAYASGVLEPS